MVTFYRQCGLQRPTPGGYTQQVAWIPEKFATLNRVLKIRVNGVWENGWVVTSVSDTCAADDDYRDCFGGGVGRRIDSHAAIRQHRRNTGDAQTAKARR